MISYKPPPSSSSSSSSPGASQSAHSAAASAPLDRIMSPTPQLAFLQASLFFREHEVFADDTARPLLPYLPPPLNTRDTAEQR